MPIVAFPCVRRELSAGMLWVVASSTRRRAGGRRCDREMALVAPCMLDPVGWMEFLMAVIVVLAGTQRKNPTSARGIRRGSGDTAPHGGTR
jgi:hypothetical protein